VSGLELSLELLIVLLHVGGRHLHITRVLLLVEAVAGALALKLVLWV